MCGLWISIGLPRLEDAITPIIRRGPDGAGEVAADTAAGPLILSHRRLAISDPTPASSQPFTLTQEGLEFVWNGALYDFCERRAELAAEGVVFQTEGDTEVMLRLLERRGLAALAPLDAMFAAAVFDRRTQRLTLARDRFGEKPLFYAQGKSADRRLWFAAGSDLRQFQAVPGLSRKIDTTRAAAFLNWGAPDPVDRTFFAEIKPLPPGCALELDLSSEQALKDSLACGAAAWPGARLEPNAETHEPATAAERLRSELAAAVRRRMTSSDVPYGACMSGGLDSSAIVALMNRIDGTCVGVTGMVEGDACSERPWIDELKAAVVIDAIETLVTSASASVAFDHVLKAQGEPIPHSSVMLQWSVFRAAKARGLRVMLDGQGADEIFGGYAGMLGAWLADHADEAGVQAFLSEVRDLAADDPGYSANGLIRDAIRARIPERFRVGVLRALGKWPPRAFIAAGAPPAARGRESFAQLSERLLLHDSLPQLLRFEDRNAMDHGVETRLPYLAPGVAALSVALPRTLKVRRGWRKAVLRDAVDGLVPDAIRNRRRKLGYSTPQHDWMSGELGQTCFQIVQDLRSSPAGGLLLSNRPLDPDQLFRVAAYLRWADQNGAGL